MKAPTPLRRCRQLLSALAVPAVFLLVVPASSFSAPTSSSVGVPSWDRLRAEHPAVLSRPPRPVYYDKLPNDDNDVVDDAYIRRRRSLPVLYRDKECICAASETVWLAMECKGVEYLTVLVSKEEDAQQAVPRIEWPEVEDEDDDKSNKGNRQSKDEIVNTETDPIKILEQIQLRYPDDPPNFYPRVSLAVDGARCSIMRLPGIMPRYSEPDFMSLAPHIFRDDGTLVKRSSHRVSLEEVEEMLEEYFLGPFLCGRDVSAADMVWAPYLERYAVQLPLTFPNVKSCHPRSNAYGEVNAWYAAMERLPAYACSVQGDARHWSKCLERVIALHNERATGEEDRLDGLPQVSDQYGWWMRTYPPGVAEKLWKEYAVDSKRPWLADTPAGEVASYLTRNRNDVIAAAAEAAATKDHSIDMNLTRDEADEALREVIQTLLGWKMDDDSPTNYLKEGKDKGESGGYSKGPILSENARKMTKFVDERAIKVPRDLGMIPAMALGQLVRSLQ
eukprot:CAMPEP_0181140816 /NCGR_PEP_ID=MMETSP1071-20121207/35500_1 /TAXON_ID=35127 /ORGANISM="Thalassiosira sp., Strain NH16" /LENGTH=503 /DNA_ID=CAMNT_0023227781 /DNA_START=428 /DNA_END=1939 /DNA_ORIENTATION=-